MQPRLLAVLSLLILAEAFPGPQIDFQSLGRVGVVGSFAGLALVNSNSRHNTTYDSAASTLVARAGNGSYTNLGATNEGGRISALCQSSSGTVYIGGLFSSIGGQSVRNIAKYEPATAAFSSLSDGVDGEVLALSCNTSTVYVGGNFKSPIGSAIGYSGNVAEWSTTSSLWSPLPFSGFNGAVETISSSPDGKSLFFGGSFTTTYSNSSSASLNSSSAPIFPSLGSSLAPLSLNTSEYVASPTTYISGFGRPQYIFCPKAADGIGSSWLLVDQQAGYFISRLFRPLNVGGVRLGNTFYQGRGTANFSFVSIPDDKVLTLTYRTNPSDINSPLATCSDNCPLSHDPNLPYTDFLFPPNTTITGFQLNIFGFYGAGGGLHLLQLLSDGAYAYAVQALNTAYCTQGLGATAGATVATQGNWQVSSVVSSIPGTTQAVLIANVQGQSSVAASPTITWSPAVTQAGIYNIFFTSPGCTIQGDCATRAKVSLSVSPITGGPITTTVIDQTNSLDTSTLIFTGSVSPNAGLSITMGLASGGAPLLGTTYALVAEKVLLVALSPNGTSTTTQRGHGLYEYVTGTTSTFGYPAPISAAIVNASSILSNSTAFDDLSFKLPATAIITSVISISSASGTRVFVGGSFMYTDGVATSASVISYSGSTVTLAPNGGLLGNVTSLIELDGFLYASGAFVSTIDGTVTGLDGVAKWQYGVAGGSWMSLGTVPAVGGSIAALGLSNIGSNSTIAAVGEENNSGVAIFNPFESKWNSTAAGLVIGNLTAYLSSQSVAASSYFAGNILAAIGSFAPGAATLSAGSDGTPQLSSLVYNLIDSAKPISPLPAKNRRNLRSILRRADDIFSRPVDRMSLMERATPINFTLPSAISSAPGNSILAGAFWMNGSTSLMLLGGHFLSSSGVSNLGIYDSSQKTLTQIAGQPIIGTVKALAVFGNLAWIGGTFSTASGRQGLSTYDLGRQLSNDSGPAFAGYVGVNVTVNTIVQRPSSTSTVIVAGAFAAAGSLPCQSICQWDTSTSQWSPFGPGLQGTVGSIAFAGSNSEYMIAAGSFLINGTTFYLAQWDFNSLLWTSLGPANALSGPVTAVSTDNGNVAKIFVAGTSLVNEPYLSFWNGTQWSDFNSGVLETGSGVQQLAFLPTLSDHSSNSLIESDRVLLVSGSLKINDTSYASALYDGASWYPYLVAATNTGSAGVVSSLFYSVGNFNLSARNMLSVGIVILISIAIALGVVLLVVLIGILVAMSRRRGDAVHQAIVRENPPTSQMANFGAATAILLDGKNEKVLPYPESEATPMSFDGATNYENPDIDSKSRARYSFIAEHPGELNVSAGEDLVILEASDANWWLVSNSSGVRGLIPSAYVA